MKKILILIILFFGILILAQESFASAPNTFRYLGTLRYNGQSVDAIKTMRFRFTSSDGSVQYWDSGEVAVVVSKGYFSYELTPALDWNNRPVSGYYFEVTVDGNVLLPREAVLSNIYSMHAGNVDDNVISEPKLTADVRLKLNRVSTGDDLGNHIATTTLNMSGFDINGAGTVNAAKVSVSNFTMGTGAVAGKVLTSDISGNASWQTSPSGVTDHTLLSNIGSLTHVQLDSTLVNVGIATATLRTDITNLAASTGTLRSDIDAKVTRAGDIMTGKLTSPDLEATYGVKAATLTVTSAIKYMDGNQGAGKALISDASGNAGWQSLGTLPGDDLGNHIATTTLNMAGNQIVNVSTISANSIRFSDGTVFISTAGVSPESLLHSTNTWTATQNFSDITANSISTGGDLKTGTASVYYLGDPSVDGSWRFLISGGDLTFQKRIGGNWVTQAEMSQ